MAAEKFPIDLKEYREVAVDPFRQEALTDEQRAILKQNIALCRDAIVLMTSIGNARGYGGHTGGPFDTVPEVVLMDAFFRASPERFVPIFFDEAGHRVATQYLLAALKGHLKPEQLLHYRVGHSHLPGHPELGYTPGIQFSSGRLGHVWPYVNGVAMGKPGTTVFCLGSDGSQMEGNDAEAARLAVAQNLNVKLVLDDNDVTIAGHPSEYLKGFSLQKTLEGHGLSVTVVDGEDLDQLYAALRQAVQVDGPFAVICKRKMCPGIAGIEGTAHGHDAIAPKSAVPYLEARGRPEAAAYLRAVKKATFDYEFKGSGRMGNNRLMFGTACVEVLGRLSAEERRNTMCIDSDLEGSTGIKAIREAYPDVYVRSGVMERGNFSAAAGFGMCQGKQGIFSTFGAFLEMTLSEVTMARLNRSNVICHYSHTGVDDMADNTCHFGLNMMFADNGLEENSHETRLYFPADELQMRAVVEAVFASPGLRFLFSVRAKTPVILGPGGAEVYGGGYRFVPGKDEVVHEARNSGYVVSFGDALYRCLDAVLRLREEGIQVGLVNKPTLNVVDEEVTRLVGRAPFVLVVESLSTKTGLGMRYGTWLLERGLTPAYAHLGVHREGCGGLWEHYPYQGIDPPSIMSKVRELHSKV